MFQSDSFSDSDSDLACVERIGTIAVVTITVAELMGPMLALSLRDLLTEAHTDGVTGLVLDLQNVQAIDSACVGALVQALTQMHEGGTGGRIALVNAAMGVTDLFRITKLDRVFPMCRDVMSALRAVEQVREEEPVRHKFWKW